MCDGVEENVLYLDPNFHSDIQIDNNKYSVKVGEWRVYRRGEPRDIYESCDIYEPRDILILLEIIGYELNVNYINCERNIMSTLS